jgi:hypothetical protein
MRRLAVVFLLTANAGLVDAASAGERIRLAQTFVTTTCMMNCNSQAATCQAACFVPGAPSVGTTTSAISLAQQPGPNPTANTTCVMNCSSQQVTCQTICSRNAYQGLQLTPQPAPPVGQ